MAEPLPPLLLDGPRGAPLTLILAHGSGAPMDTPFMNFFAEHAAGEGLRVVRFEFPYMQRRRTEGVKAGPDSRAKLIAAWEAVIAHCRQFAAPLLIGGKSMGGRIASLLADQQHVAGLVCLGYPFYAAGKADKPRIDHLRELRTPTLIIQGERDPMGDRPHVEPYALSPHVQLLWLPDGDHSFKPRKSSGHTETDNWTAAAQRLHAFAAGLLEST